MKCFHIDRAALVAVLVFGFLVVTPLTEAVAQKENVDHIVLVLKKKVNGKDKCVTNPEILEVNKKGRQLRIGFVALTPKVVVKELNSKPGVVMADTNLVVFLPDSRKIKHDTNGPVLSDRASLTIAEGGMEILKLNKLASGTYQYNVTCDTTPDDPPTIIVD